MQRMMQGWWRIAAAALLAAMAGFPATPAAAQGPAEMQCRAACGQLPREDRARVLACLQRCGVTLGVTPQASRAQGASVQFAQAPAGHGLGRRVAGLPETAAAPPARGAQGQRWGAIYAAPAPYPGLGVAAGQHDRLAAHGRAEQACAAGSRGLPCRMLVEFTQGCAAAAHALRGDRIAFTTAELGPTRQQAERAALGACQARSRDTACQVVRTACAAG